MITDEKIYNAALIKYRLGIVLLWMGVLTYLAEALQYRPKLMLS
jgi:hypothetical protein